MVSNLSRLTPRFLGGCAMTALVLTGVFADPAHSAPSDYRFEIVRPVEASGGGSTVTVALIHTPSGTRVANADVFRRDIVLRDKGSVRLGERHIPLAPDGQGNYRLTTYYPLGDATVLKLGARIAGETGTLRSALTARPAN